LPVMWTFDTTDPLSTDPIEIPWPPVHLLFWNTIFEPLLMARQSSWLTIVLSWIVTSLVETRL
jgi:hypothetical protein